MAVATSPRSRGATVASPVRGMPRHRKPSMGGPPRLPVGQEASGVDDLAFDRRAAIGVGGGVGGGGRGAAGPPPPPGRTGTRPGPGHAPPAPPPRPPPPRLPPPPGPPA